MQGAYGGLIVILMYAGGSAIEPANGLITQSGLFILTQTGDFILAQPAP